MITLAFGVDLHRTIKPNPCQKRVLDTFIRVFGFDKWCQGTPTNFIEVVNNDTKKRASKEFSWWVLQGWQRYGVLDKNLLRVARELILKVR